MPPRAAFAAPQAAGQIAPVRDRGLGQVTLALLAVLAAVFAVAWLVRRVRGFGNRVGTAIDVLAEVPLGPKERAVLLKVGQAQILLGVAPGTRVHAACARGAARADQAALPPRWSGPHFAH